MNSRSRVALLSPLLLLTLAACPHPSTVSSIARSERPTLPIPPAELAKPERPSRLAPAPTAELVTVDKGELQQLTDGYAEALGMVKNLNRRIAGWSTWAACEKAELATGIKPKGC